MKNWINASIEELNITATAQNPTELQAVDEYQNGWFKQGISDGSGPVEQIDYYPQR